MSQPRGKRREEESTTSAALSCQDRQRQGRLLRARASHALCKHLRLRIQQDSWPLRGGWRLRGRRGASFVSPSTPSWAAWCGASLQPGPYGATAACDASASAAVAPSVALQHQQWAHPWGNTKKTRLRNLSERGWLVCGVCVGSGWWWCGREIDNDVSVDVESRKTAAQHGSIRRPTTVHHRWLKKKSRQGHSTSNWTESRKKKKCP